MLFSKFLGLIPVIISGFSFGFKRIGSAFLLNLDWFSQDRISFYFETILDIFFKIKSWFLFSPLHFAKRRYWIKKKLEVDLYRILGIFKEIG
jgi:hypothetical protein